MPEIQNLFPNTSMPSCAACRPELPQNITFWGEIWLIFPLSKNPWIFQDVLIRNISQVSVYVPGVMKTWISKFYRKYSSSKYSKTNLLKLTLSWRRPLSYRNQSIDLQSKSMDWFLYDNNLRHEKVNIKANFGRQSLYF